MEKDIIELKEQIERLEKNSNLMFSLLDRTLNIIVDNQKKVDQRFDKVDSQLSDLKGDSVHTIVTLESSLNDIIEELRKINKVTGYIDQHANSSMFGNKGEA